MRNVIQKVVACGFMLCLGSSVTGNTVMESPQRFDIWSNTWNQAMTYNFDNGDQGVFEPAFGPNTITTFIPVQQWKGIYLYDYDHGRFVEGFYFYDNFL